MIAGDGLQRDPAPVRERGLDGGVMAPSARYRWGCVGITNGRLLMAFTCAWYRTKRAAESRAKIENRNGFTTAVARIELWGRM